MIDQGRAMFSQKNLDATASVLIYEEDLQTGEWVETQSLNIGGAEDSNTSAAIVEHDISALVLDNDQLMVGVREVDLNGIDAVSYTHLTLPTKRIV